MVEGMRLLVLKKWMMRGDENEEDMGQFNFQSENTEAQEKEDAEEIEDESGQETEDINKADQQEEFQNAPFNFESEDTEDQDTEEVEEVEAQEDEGGNDDATQVTEEVTE